MRSAVLANSDVMLFAAGLVATFVLALIPTVRGLVGRLLHVGLYLAQAVGAAVARVYDRLLPISERNAAVSRWALGLWSAFNLAPVLAWIVASEGAAPWQGEIAIAAAALTLINALFLSGAYWAYKESIDFMNGDMTLKPRRFGDLSTATSMPILLTALAIGFAQVVVVQQWLQEQHAMTFIVVKSSLGIRYLDHLVAVLGALPVSRSMSRRPACRNASTCRRIWARHGRKASAHSARCLSSARCSASGSAPGSCGA